MQEKKEKPEQEAPPPSGATISRRDFAKKIAQGMVGFIMLATIGTSNATVCIGETDVNCSWGGNEIDENCGSLYGSPATSFDKDQHCRYTYGSGIVDPDNSCGVLPGGYWQGGVFISSADENCGSVYGSSETHDVDQGCGGVSEYPKAGGVYYDQDEGCRPKNPGPYDKDDNCGNQNVYIIGGKEVLGDPDPDDDGQ